MPKGCQRGPPSISNTSAKNFPTVEVFIHSYVCGETCKSSCSPHRPLLVREHPRFPDFGAVKPLSPLDTITPFYFVFLETNRARHVSVGQGTDAGVEPVDIVRPELEIPSMDR